MRIAVLNLEIYRTLGHEDKLLHVIAEVWRRQGHEVVDLYGVSEEVEADLLFLHVDLSVVPEEYLAFAARYPKVANLKAVDIRKSAYSRNLVRPGDDWTGPVMVKSDNNYGGRPEKILIREKIRRQPLLSLLDKCNRRLARLWAGERPLPFDSYPVFPSWHGVPAGWWGRKDLVVEKFVPEREGDFYVLRKYCFLGRRSLFLKSWGKDPVVSTKTQEGSEILHHEVPEELMDFRRRLGLDYGKIDYGIVDGRCLIYDANKTIGTPRERNAKVGECAGHLADGLRDLAG